MAAFRTDCSRKLSTTICNWNISWLLCKPSQPEEILNEFCAEYLHLKQNGFMYQQKKIHGDH